MAETRRDDVKDARKVEPGGLLSGPIPGDATEGSSARDRVGTLPDEGFDQEAEMERLESWRGETRAGQPVEGVDIGTPAGASSDALRNREEVPVHERNKGQSKDRRDPNIGGRR